MKRMKYGNVAATVSHLNTGTSFQNTIQINRPKYSRMTRPMSQNCAETGITRPIAFPQLQIRKDTLRYIRECIVEWEILKLYY